jgi:hypothetical protein
MQSFQHTEQAELKLHHYPNAAGLRGIAAKVHVHLHTVGSSSCQSTPSVLDGFPVSECSLDRQEISRFVEIWVILDNDVSPCEAATSCRSNSIFREHLSQCISELVIKR